MIRPSVALCTFNGGRFLREQLQSIAAQSTPPAELVICDDGSTDDTVAIAEAFARTAPFRVDVRRNRTRLGTAANFDSAMSLCNGDVIFLCDQDDVWHPEKIARTIRQFDDLHIQCVFTDARLIDEEGKPIGRTMWQQIGFDPRRFDFGTVVDRNVATGATMALRASLRPLIQPIPRDQPHDWWIVLLSAATQSATPLNEPLIDYRVHKDQQSGAGPRVGSLNTWIDASRQTGPQAFRARAERLKLLRDRLASAGVSIDIADRIAHLETRAEMRGMRRPLLVARELLTGRYFRYSRHVFSAAKDLFGIASSR
ncbi:MAG: glycosyltransferase family 2 protein [Thermoanaerobaculia bacterium]